MTEAVQYLKNSKYLLVLLILPGADWGSDHQLLSARISVRLKKSKRERPVIRYDVSSISDASKSISTVDSWHCFVFVRRRHRTS